MGQKHFVFHFDPKIPTSEGMKPVPSADERRIAVDFVTNLDCPLRRYPYSGDEHGLRTLAEAAFVALERGDHSCSDFGAFLIGERDEPKRKLAMLFADLLRIPFVEIGPHDDSSRSASSMFAKMETDFNTTGLKLTPVGIKKYRLPPCVIFVRNADFFPESLDKIAIASKEDRGCLLLTENDYQINCRAVCWLIDIAEYKAALKAQFDAKFQQIVITAVPKDSEGFRERAEFNFNGEAYVLAVADLTEAIRLDPKNSQAYRDRGDAYLTLDREGEEWEGDPLPLLAILDFTQYIRLTPKDSLAKAEAHFLRGLCHSRRQDSRCQAIELAFVDFTAAIRMGVEDEELITDVCDEMTELVSRSITKTDQTDKDAEIKRLNKLLGESRGEIGRLTALVTRLETDLRRKEAVRIEYEEVLDYYEGIMLKMKAEIERLRASLRQVSADQSQRYEQVPCPYCCQTGIKRPGILGIFLGEPESRCRICGGKGWLLE